MNNPTFDQAKELNALRSQVADLKDELLACDTVISDADKMIETLRAENTRLREQRDRAYKAGAEAMREEAAERAEDWACSTEEIPVSKAIRNLKVEELK